MEIRARLACSSGVDGFLIADLDRHTHELRLLDRQLGAATILDAISAHITTVRRLDDAHHPHQRPSSAGPHHRRRPKRSASEPAVRTTAASASV